jgi:DNA-binding MarR family transcriptional regulator
MASAAELAPRAVKLSKSYGFAPGETLNQHAELHAGSAVIGAAPSTPGRRVSERQILDVIKARRARAKHFSGDLFADPAWDILLELYAAELGQRRICVSSVCAGAAVPQTTALRWIKVLEAKGLIHRTEDRFDHRRHHLSLSAQASASMTAYFSMPSGQSALRI